MQVPSVLTALLKKNFYTRACRGADVVEQIWAYGNTYELSWWAWWRPILTDEPQYNKQSGCGNAHNPSG